MATAAAAFEAADGSSGSNDTTATTTGMAGVGKGGDSTASLSLRRSAVSSAHQQPASHLGALQLAAAAGAHSHPPAFISAWLQQPFPASCRVEGGGVVTWFANPALRKNWADCGQAARLQAMCLPSSGELDSKWLQVQHALAPPRPFPPALCSPIPWRRARAGAAFCHLRLLHRFRSLLPPVLRPAAACHCAAHRRRPARIALRRPSLSRLPARWRRTRAIAVAAGCPRPDTRAPRGPARLAARRSSCRPTAASCCSSLLRASREWRPRRSPRCAPWRAR